MHFQPYWFGKWYSPKCIELVRNLINKNTFYFIQVECSQLLYLVNIIPKNIFRIYSAYDVSSVSFFRRLFTKNFIKFILSFWFLIEVWIYELVHIKNFNISVFMSMNDESISHKLFGDFKSIISENGLTINSTTKGKFREDKSILNIGFIGSINHPPNMDAINFIINEIYPRIGRQIKYRFFIAGNPNIKLPRNSFINLGIVEDLSTFFGKIDVLIAPIFSGSGTRIKILDSLSYGIPVISTSIGIEGLPYELSKHIVIANSASEFVAELSNIYISANSTFIQDSILEKYSWTQIFKKQYKTIYQLINK